MVNSNQSILPAQSGDVFDLKRPSFDIASEAIVGASRIELEGASVVLDKHRDLLQTPGVVGIWVGAAKSKPFIMVAVRQGHSKQLRRAIPDSLDGISVYYVEGKPYS